MPYDRIVRAKVIGPRHSACPRPWEPAIGGIRSLKAVRNRPNRNHEETPGMTRPLTTPPPPKSPRHPGDDVVMPPYTPGSVPPPDGDLPKSDRERTPPPNTYPPKQNP
ncbi:hypothetical protein GCM10022293_22030 [Azospirillum formosense]